jgi:UDP-N-acetylmuramoyl-L-alanyl-D-glutamate--2,6-diaminopimelate ligase
MKLKQLLKGLNGLEVKGSKEIEITGLSVDSRSTAPGHLFIAKKGTQFHGAQFMQQAINSGAAVVLNDLYDPFFSQTQIIHPQPALLEALLAARFYQFPSQELFVFGATGTKGKTTTTYVARHVLEALNIATGLIGGVQTIAAEQQFPSTLTTHDAIFNQKWLREMVFKKCRGAVLEVSSHGLAQNRVAEITFDAALFTNLSSDHLDYHKTIEEYASCKKRLFQGLDQSSKKNKRAFFNGDSAWTPWMREGLKTPSWTFGVEAPADIRAKNISFGLEGTRFTVDFQGQSALFETSLIGKYNVYNLLGPIALGLHLGASLQDLGAPVASFRPVPGRFERVGNSIFIDFAHTGDSLANVLCALRPLVLGRLFVVFGCGGNRDPNRRYFMAKAAEKYADGTVITTDNCRSEDPEAICRQILSGFERPGLVHVELDRRAAIFHAVQMLKKGDVLVIAGKGHEKSQIFAHQTVPFDDVSVAKEALQGKEVF